MTVFDVLELVVWTVIALGGIAFAAALHWLVLRTLWRSCVDLVRGEHR